jgi:type I restriction enzyme S subunit
MTFRLGDVAEMNPRGDMSHLSDDTVVGFVPMSAVSETTKTITSPETRRFGDVRKGYTPMRNGDVIVAKITPCFENGKLAIVDLEQSVAFGSTEFHVFRPTGEVDSRLLYHLLSSELIQKEGRNQMKGAAGQKRVPSDFFRAFEFRVPRSLPEQKRLAKILDKADEVRRKLQQSLRLSDDFLRSVFLDMFGDPEGQGWESTTVEELASAKKGSIRTRPFGSQLLHSEFVDEGVAVLGIDNAVRNKFAWGQPRFITEEKYEDLKRYTVHPGDVLITIMGTCGRCAIVPEDIPKAINTKHLCCITPDPKKCLPEFLHSYFLLHPMAKSYLGQSAKGAIMDGLNGGLIKSLPVPIVPIALQRKYAQLVKNRTKLADRLTNQAAESEALFSSLQQRAFRGEL